ncbi:MAG: hypothetical protein GXP24_12190 [Planctomycetes bacterium]|nr:hypothetical protein [Planctomycetota bacterium]
MSPTSPQSAEFGEQLAAAGACFDRAQVSAIYLVHGTFVGNDLLGLATELSRFAPGLSKKLSRCGKHVVDTFTGEAGNYTHGFAAALEAGLTSGAGQTIPARLFPWSSQNNHIARADGAIRLINELAQHASTSTNTGTNEASRLSRVQLWGHSHGGNVLALVTQLLGADHDARNKFFQAARSFYQPWIRQTVDMPLWQQVRSLLDDADHPVRKLLLDIVTFGTPIRYGWNANGYAKLLHFIHHRPPPQREEYSAPIPLKLLRARKALDGDYIQQIGIAGTNIMPLPFAVRTLLADWRLDQLLEADVARESIMARLHHGARVPDEGTTLLTDYTEISPWLVRNIAGHGLYTRQKWLPFHCHEITKRFYGDDPV